MQQNRHYSPKEHFLHSGDRDSKLRNAQLLTISLKIGEERSEPVERVQREKNLELVGTARADSCRRHVMSHVLQNGFRRVFGLADDRQRVAGSCLVGKCV